MPLSGCFSGAQLDRHVTLRFRVSVYSGDDEHVATGRELPPFGGG
jgi:hypothetical protein